MKVSDVMSRQVEFTVADNKVRDAVALIFARGINGVPVCKGRKLVGFVTERDIMNKFYPTMQEYMEDPVSARNFEEMEKTIDEIFDLNVEQIMSKNPTTVEPDAPLLRAHSLMNIRKVGRLPVIDKKGNLIGMITKGDIFGALVGDKLIFTENEDYNDWLSKIYYAAVDWKNRLENEMPDFLKAFKENHVKTIIDIGCGTGEHPIEFAKEGFYSVGVDRSRSMIDQANLRRKTLSDEVKKRISFYRDEAIDFFKKTKEVYDCAVVMGNTLSHNPHVLDKLIEAITKKLLAKGVLILQITNFEKVLKTHKRLLSFNFAKLENGVKREYAFLEFYDLPNLKDKTILKTFAILRSDGKHWKTVGVRNSLMAYTSKESVKNLLRKYGFSKISFYGGFFDGREWDSLFRRPFKPLESDWLNVIAKR